ncbi:GntR family transcriptional regulator [Actinophytocola sp. NPDC049390]|uniref:GntR family transcriptional regulator n=1 Tax=Actinophytocola sp. NPDC049390 TaxID=3363894 RepID=UPI00378ACB0F
MAEPTELLVALDREANEPLYAQIANQVEVRIRNGELIAGAQLENELDMSKRLGVSRPTLRRAFAELVARGLVARRPSIGTVVLPTPIDRPLTIESLYDDLAREGRDPTTRVLTVDHGPCPPELAARLGRDLGTMVRIERVRCADGRPLAVLRNWLPIGGPELTADRLRREGLYRILRSQGVHPHLVDQVITCRSAEPAEAELLEVPRRSPVPMVRRTVFDRAGNFVEYGSHVYRADRYSFHVMLVERPSSARGRPAVAVRRD